MDSQPTTQTSISREIRVVHLEPTDVCQLACPQCARETDPAFDKHRKHHLTVDQIAKHLTEDVISGLDKMFMCGDYGDPAAGQHTLDIYRHFRKINPGITLGMNTNGGLQTTFWWYELAKILSKETDYVVFSIDGLEDTNHVYRKNINWPKLMANVESFIAAGGRAHWDMLVYRHNQHQVDACAKLAKDMGFQWFRAKVSRRPFTRGLDFPLGWRSIDSTPGPISCHALKEQSLYIDSQGKISPCCWLGNRAQIDSIDFDSIQASWQTDQPHAMCRKTCSIVDRTQFDQQWQREVNLKDAT